MTKLQFWKQKMKDARKLESDLRYEYMDNVQQLRKIRKDITKHLKKYKGQKV